MVVVWDKTKQNKSRWIKDTRSLRHTVIYCVDVRRRCRKMSQKKRYVNHNTFQSLRSNFILFFVSSKKMIAIFIKSISFPFDHPFVIFLFSYFEFHISHRVCVWYLCSQIKLWWWWYNQQMLKGHRKIFDWNFCCVWEKLKTNLKQKPFVFYNEPNRSVSYSRLVFGNSFPLIHKCVNTFSQQFNSGKSPIWWKFNFHTMKSSQKIWSM